MDNGTEGREMTTIVTGNELSERERAAVERFGRDEDIAVESRDEFVRVYVESADELSGARLLAEVNNVCADARGETR